MEAAVEEAVEEEEEEGDFCTGRDKDSCCGVEGDAARDAALRAERSCGVSCACSHFGWHYYKLCAHASAASQNQQWQGQVH